MDQEQLQSAPKISKNSTMIAKNSKRAKENEEIKQMLLGNKAKQQGIDE